MALNSVLCVVTIFVATVRSFVITQEPLEAPIRVVTHPGSGDLPNPLPLVIWHGLGDKYSRSSTDFITY